MAVPLGDSRQVDRWAGDFEDPLGSWRAMRERLLREQRQREAENGLIALLTELHTGLNLAQGRAPGSVPQAPKARAAVLRALDDGINALLTWRGEQWQVTAPGAGAEPARPLAPGLLGRAQEQYPLFETTQVTATAVHCADLVESIGQLRGADGDVFFAEALGGFTLMLATLFDHLRDEAPTAATVFALESTWLELLAEVKAFAPELASTDERRSATDSHWPNDGGFAAGGASRTDGPHWTAGDSHLTATAANEQPAANNGLPATGAPLAALDRSSDFEPALSTPKGRSSDSNLIRFHRLELVEIVELVKSAAPEVLSPWP